MLEDRTKKSCYSAMDIIKRSCPNFAPESVMLDFEIAERSAIKELFPGTELRGCFFHWKQCLIRKFKAVKGYPRDPTVRENLHCLFGLAFVPEPDVPGCWDMLKKNTLEQVYRFPPSPVLHGNRVDQEYNLSCADVECVQLHPGQRPEDE